MNKINILDDSIQLYSFAGTEKEILKTFGKKQITYKIENNNIKVFAYNDYFYRGCLWSSDIPLIINDEEYSSIDDIITKLDEWFYSPNEGGGGDIDIDPSLSPTSKNPVANSAITNAINSLPSMTDVNSAITNATSGLASTEWVEAQHYLTEHTPLKTINDQVISGTGNITISADTSNFYSKQETDALLDDKMDVSGMTDYSTKEWVQNQHYLTEHTPLKTINGETISGTGDIVITAETVDAYTKEETNALLDDKQDVLSAGTGINISGNVISVTLDTDLFVIVQELPTTGDENKFYLVPTENSGSSNVYAEYIYTNNAWEKIGEEVVDVDLTPYLKKTDAAATYLSNTDAASTYATKSELDDFYSKSETDTLLDGKADASDIADMATTGWVESQGYLTEHTTLKTINNQVISGTGNIDIPVFQLRWVADGDNYICDMVTHTKYQQDKQQVTFDGGAYYMDIGNVRRGEVIETESVDCGADPSTKYMAKFTFGDGTVQYMDGRGELSSAYTCAYSAAVQVDIYTAVTEIGDGCFRSFHNLSSVTIPNTVWRIGKSAFNTCNNLSSITIPSSVTLIGDDAFENCTSMTSITSYASSAPKVSAYTFAYIATGGTLYIPNADEETYSKWLSNAAFYLGYYNWNVHKTNRWVADGDNYICSGSSGYDKYQQEKQQVSYNDGQTWLDVSPKQTRVGELLEANSIDCGADPSLTKKAKLTLNNGTNVYVPKNQITELTSGETAQYSASTVSAEIYSGVTTLGVNALAGFGNLSSVTISDNVTSIGNGALQNCHSLSSVTLPNGVTSIGQNSFYYCENLTSINIPSGVTSIPLNAFQDCHSLTSITIPSAVTSIGNSAFYECRNLTSINVPDNVATIGQMTFYNCTGITDVTIGSGLTSIGDGGFYNCSSLSAITANPTNYPTFGTDVFEGVSETGVLTYNYGTGGKRFIDYIPSGWEINEIPPANYKAKATYESGNVIYTLNNGSTVLENGEVSIFNYYESVQRIEVTTAVTSIGNNALENQETGDMWGQWWGSASAITLSDTLISIGNYAFLNQMFIPSITIPSGVTTIGNGAFSGCTGLTEITCNATTAPTLGTNVFNGLPENGTLYVPSGSNYSTWMSELPSGWIQVSSDAMGIIAKTSDGSRYVISANTETTAGTLTWHEPYNCAIAHGIGQNEDVTVEILPTVTTVGDSSFTTWYGLSSIVIPSTVTTVGPQSFTQCSGLTSITCLATTAPTLYGSNVFNGISSTGTLYVPTGATGYNAWFGQNALPSGWTISYI